MLQSLKILFLTGCFCLLCLNSGLAYQIELTGVAQGLQEAELWIQCSAWKNARQITRDEKGQFQWQMDSVQEGRYTLTYGSGFLAIRTHFFVFEDVRYEIKLLNDSLGQDHISVRGGNRKTEAFRKAQDFMDQLYLHKPTGASSIQNIMPFLSSIYGIDSSDTFTQVYIQSAYLNYLRVMQVDYALPVGLRVFDLPEFAALKGREASFLGFPDYRDLMIAWEWHQLQRYLGGDQFLFANCLNALSEEESLPEVLHLQIIAKLLKHFRYERLGEEEKTLYHNTLVSYLQKYAHGYLAEALTDRLTEIEADLLHQTAPDFLLTDASGTFHRLSDYRGQPIMIDVWGSWCPPCREKNQALKEWYYDQEVMEKEVLFISIAVEQKVADWRTALQEDQMPWLQLLADDVFIDQYGIRQYPTLILIDEYGQITFYDHAITKMEWQVFLEGISLSINE